MRNPFTSSDDSKDDEEELAPKVGTPEWSRQHRKRMAESRRKHDRAETWINRGLVVVAVLVALTFLATIGALVFLGMHFGEIVDFIRGFQPEVLLA